MFSSRATALSLYLPKALYDCSRSVRLGVSIPIKKVNPVLKPRRAETYNEKEFIKMRRDNQGIAHSLMRRVESGYDDNVLEDPESFLDTDMDAFDSNFIFKENKRLAVEDVKKGHFHSIKRKYFKEEKLPNMLTYIEKQQIKRLHKEDPEFWNIDKLAESFPASPNIIKKVLQSIFTAYTVENVQRHDKTVRKNWDLFRKGKLSFDKKLEDHYAKFAGRLKFETNVNEIKKFLPPPPDFNDQPIKEFSGIIASSKKYKMLQDNERRKIEIDESGSIIHTSKDMKINLIHEDSYTQFPAYHFTLDELRKRINSDCRTPTDALIMERAPKKSLPLPSEIEEANDNLKRSDCANREFEATNEQATEESWSCASDAQKSEYKNPKAGRKKKHTEPTSAPRIDKSIDIYKEFDYLSKETGVIGEKLPHNFAENKMDHVRLKVHIPENMWQKDKLYRIKDCFYDDEGVFLYRVPGLF